MSETIDLVTVLDASSHNQLQKKAHTMIPPRMHNEPGSFCRDAQPLNVDARQIML